MNIINSLNLAEAEHRMAARLPQPVQREVLVRQAHQLLRLQAPAVNLPQALGHGDARRRARRSVLGRTRLRSRCLRCLCSSLLLAALQAADSALRPLGTSTFSSPKVQPSPVLAQCTKALLQVLQHALPAGFLNGLSDFPIGAGKTKTKTRTPLCLNSFDTRVRSWLLNDVVPERGRKSWSTCVLLVCLDV